MAIPVLVVTPNKGFGELIQQSLEEAGGYAAFLADSGAEAVAIQKSNAPAVCVLDAGLRDAPLNELVEILRGEDHELLLVLIPAEGDLDPQPLEALEADAVLEKPFYLPTLLETVESVVQESGLDNLDRVESPKTSLPRLTKMDSRPEISTPDWLRELDDASAHFKNLTVAEPAQSALIIKGGEVWTYTSSLSAAAAQEVARTVTDYWDAEGGDLARFVEFEQTGDEHMMYATSMGEDFVLVILFEASAPFSKLRSIAGDIAQLLAQAPPAAQPFSTKEEPQSEIDEHTPPFGIELDDTPESTQPLLEDVPPSVPEDWRPRTPGVGVEGREFEREFPPATETIPPPPQFIELAPEDETGEYIETDPAYQPGSIAAEVPDYLGDTHAQGPDTLVEYSSDTVPTKQDKNGRPIKVEPVSPALYHLSYACVLIPRFPHHHLTGPFADHLSTWVTQLCLAFGWRLEHLSIRPNYLQWIVNLPPSASPGHLMRIIRQHTSRRLFVQYPHYEQENPSGDFWAPGYFILSSDQPPPADLVQEFIQQTRYRQGISRTG